VRKLVEEGMDRVHIQTPVQGAQRGRIWGPESAAEEGEVEGAPETGGCYGRGQECSDASDVCYSICLWMKSENVSQILDFCSSQLGA
jgi:hypothetical protein